MQSFAYPEYLLRKTALIQFILYSRTYCHLCEDMLQALQKFSDNYLFTVEVIDVDADETLLAQYDELVPVLSGIKHGETTQLCHYFLDEENVKAFLDG
ncbi:MAG TPA: glutaredoxin family protein [Burkholderiaceae bacterium]|nr:glutaredoxin family protein [Burkholderiaceae bacterium]